MSGYKVIPAQTKQEALEQVKEGKAVKDVAAQFGIHIKTIYRWLDETSGGSGSNLEISRLKRANEELLKIIGTLTLELQKTKKK